MSAQPAIPATEPLPALGPVLGRERIEVIDMLRGLAIFGILLVNMSAFSMPEDFPAGQVWPSLADRAVQELILFFAKGKFVALFSFLFGLGLAVQVMRAEARGARFVPVYLRRLLVLLLIGLAHTLLLWDGDILHTYALFGFPLLLFRKRPPKTLLVWAAVFLLIPMLLFAAAAGFTVYRRAHPQALSQVIVIDPAEDKKQMEEDLRIYSRGTYAEMVRRRASDLPSEIFILVGILDILALFLLGLYAGRRGIFHDVAAHLPLIRRVRWWGLGVGLVGNVVFVIGGSPYPSLTSVRQNVGAISLIISGPALGFFYASTMILLAQKEAWQRRLAPLAAVGRLALSNYLLQSLVCTTIFYSYGLGLYGKVRPVYGLALTLVIFLLQVPLSLWWLRRFQFGPMEWLWRSLTYLRLQPMRLSPAQAVRK